MLMRLVDAFFRRADPRPAAPAARPRAAAALGPADTGSRRHLARAAGGEWRAHCVASPHGPASLDGGLDRTAVLVWRDGARTVQPMGG